MGWDAVGPVDGWLSPYGSHWETGEGVCLQGTVKVEGWLRKWSISLYGSSARGNWRHKTWLWGWAPLSMGASLGNPGRRLICQGLMYGRRLWDCSLSLQGHQWGTWGRGYVYQELWELAEGGLWLRSISLYGSSVRGIWKGAPLLGTLKVR